MELLSLIDEQNTRRPLYGSSKMVTFLRTQGYLKGYRNAMELMFGLAEYFVFCNDECPHQSLGSRTPAAVYATASGRARIVDKISKMG